MARSAANLKRDLYGPSLFEITLGAALSIALGGVLAAGYLMAQPVDTVRTLPREPNPDKVYYVVGSARSSLGNGWLRKKQMLIEPGAATLQLSEDELNTWLASTQTQPESPSEGGMIKPRTLNFRIGEDYLQVGLPCDISVAGFNHSLVIQTRGTFKPTGDGFAYAADEVMVGQLAAHRLPLVGSLVVGRLAALHEPPGDLVAAWQTLTDVTVADRQLNLVRK